MEYRSEDWLAFPDAVIDCSVVLMALMLVVGIFK
jgi:hypothetical protein